MQNDNISAVKRGLIADIEKRLEDKIIEQSNADLLKKLIKNAENADEAIAIAALGTTYKRTGFHFDKRLERMTDTIKYFKKDEALSFVDENNLDPNKLIIGDNYEALLNLLVQYKRSVDVIYIDPPYGKDNMGEFAETNYNNAITRDNLLSMLYSRLVIAKELLSDIGVIFCSIDDRNMAYIKCLFDEIFGENNSSGVMIWQKKKKPSFLSNNFGSKFEYILTYTKDANSTFPFSVETTTVGKKIPLNNAGNPRKVIKFAPHSVLFNLPDCIVKAQDMSDGNIVTVLLNDVEISDGENVNEFSLDGEWRDSQKSIDEDIASGNKFVISKIPFRPNRISDGGEIKKMNNFLSPDSYNCETNEDGTQTLREIMGAEIFKNPKPVGLIELLLKATTYDNQSATILDFFAGSGTTGQAVMELNYEDGGNRKFILCQLNEKTETTPNGIAHDVTAKRLKRVMTGECYDGTADFDWIKKRGALGGSLDVYSIASVSNAEYNKGKTPFDVIDETLYGQEKFDSLKKKVEWVCNNFQNAQKMCETDNDWEKRVTGE